MCEDEDSAGPDSESCARDEDRSFNPAQGWRAVSGDAESRIVRIANKKISLLDVMRRYGIKIVRNPKRPDWSESIRCPFHKGGRERTGSFGYSFKENFFKCLACGVGGGAVEFIALKEGKDKILVAERILEQYGCDIENEIIDDDDPKIEKAMLSFGSFLNEYAQKHKHDEEAMVLYHKLMWWFDQYLLKKVPRGRIEVEEIQARIDKIKELLEE